MESFDMFDKIFDKIIVLIKKDTYTSPEEYVAILEAGKLDVQAGLSEIIKELHKYFQDVLNSIQENRALQMDMISKNYSDLKDENTVKLKLLLEKILKRKIIQDTFNKSIIEKKNVDVVEFLTELILMIRTGDLTPEELVGVVHSFRELYRVLDLDNLLLNLADDVEGLQYVKREAMTPVIIQCLNYIYKIDGILGQGKLQGLRESSSRIAKHIVAIKEHLRKDNKKQEFVNCHKCKKPFKELIQVKKENFLKESSVHYGWFCSSCAIEIIKENENENTTS
jgi:hypothetical protein